MLEMADRMAASVDGGFPSAPSSLWSTSIWPPGGTAMAVAVAHMAADEIALGEITGRRAEFRGEAVHRVEVALEGSGPTFSVS